MHLKFADTQRYRINIEDRMGGGGILTLSKIKNCTQHCYGDFVVKFFGMMCNDIADIKLSVSHELTFD